MRIHKEVKLYTVYRHTAKDPNCGQKWTLIPDSHVFLSRLANFEASPRRPWVSVLATVLLPAPRPGVDPPLPRPQPPLRSRLLVPMADGRWRGQLPLLSFSPPRRYRRSWPGFVFHNKSTLSVQQCPRCALHMPTGLLLLRLVPAMMGPVS